MTFREARAAVTGHFDDEKWARLQLIEERMQRKLEAWEIAKIFGGIETERKPPAGGGFQQEPYWK